MKEHAGTGYGASYGARHRLTAGGAGAARRDRYQPSDPATTHHDRPSRLYKFPVVEDHIAPHREQRIQGSEGLIDARVPV